VVALHAALSGEPVAAGPAQADQPAGLAADLPLLLVVEDDRELGDRLVAEAAARGLRCALIGDPDAARRAADREPPAAALVSLTLAAGPQDALDLLAELNGQEPPVPVLVLANGDEFSDRVEVARRGGRGFLQKPVPAATAVEAARELLARADPAEARVLVMDDDRAVLDAVAALLSAQGMAVTTSDDPRQFWHVLEDTAPDLLVLDVEMPHLDGVELCRVVRNDQRWSELPVLFLTARTEPQLVRRLFAAGADDYVSKPVTGPELATRIAGRLERVRLYRKLADTDVLTGVANRRKAVQSLGQFLRLADRLGLPLCLAVLDLDEFKQVNDRYGHALGDTVLRRFGTVLQRTFRAEDVVARWGGEEFVVGLHGSSRADGMARLGRLLEAFRHETFTAEDGTAFRVTFSAGVAQYPDDGEDLQALYRAADQALYQAKTARRDRVVPVGGDP
jgi:diguanylate cyclase (GGDEF)-like protein